MGRLTVILFLIGFAFACTFIPEPGPVDPEKSESDSLLAIYGQSISTTDLKYLRHYKVDRQGNTLLYGDTSEKFWFGVFGPDQTKLKEHLLDLDIENKIKQPESVISIIDFVVMGKLIFQVNTFESPYSPTTQTGKTIMGLSESDYELSHISDYLRPEEMYYIKMARPWKGGFLLEFDASLGKVGRDYTQFISRDFSESIKWDCKAPQSPRIGVYYFERDFYLDVIENGVFGFDYSTCRNWSYNTLDFFGKTTCPGCTSSILLKQQVGPEITLDVTLDNEVRRIVIEYRTGRIVSNERI